MAEPLWPSVMCRWAHRISQTSFAKSKIDEPQVVFNTLNGDSNLAFFRQYRAAGITASRFQCCR